MVADKHISQEYKMTKSYKMMWRDGLIVDGLSHSFDIKNFAEYTPGRQFVAQSGHSYERFGVRASKPVFHFCDNAIDTLMWYWQVFDFMDYDAPTIHFFEIKPLAPVFKNQAPDETMLWQCGTNKLEIIRETSLQQVAKDACVEIEQNKSEIIARYPHYNMDMYIKKIIRCACK